MAPRSEPPSQHPRRCPRPFWVLGGLFLLIEAFVCVIYERAAWKNTGSPTSQNNWEVQLQTRQVLEDALEIVHKEASGLERPTQAVPVLNAPAHSRQQADPEARIRHAPLGECQGSRPRGLLQPDCRWAWDDLPQPRLIVEFGGNQGDDLQHFLDLHSQAIIHSFEPVQKYFSALRTLFGENSRVRLHQFGVSGDDAKVFFRTDGDAAAASEFGTAKGEDKPVYEEVILRDAYQLLQEIVSAEGREIDVLSINCEGCEYAILERLAATGWLGRLGYLQVSWHTSSQIPQQSQRRCKLLEQLRTRFRPAYQADFAWEGFASTPRSYAVDERFLGEADPVKVGMGNGIGQAQGGLQCPSDPSTDPPAAARWLDFGEDPEASHLTYPQTIQGDVVTAVLLGKAFLLPGADNAKPPLIVEVGAGDGAGVRFHQVLGKNPTARVHSFEPVPFLRAKLQASAAAMNLTTGGRVVWPVGWSDADRRVRFRTWGSDSTRLLRSKSQRWEGQVEDVELWDAGRAMKTVVDSEGREPALLYLNCEGCEYDVLQRLLDTGWLQTLPRLAVSWHAGGAPWRRRCALDAILRRSHWLETAAESYELWVLKA